jgi:staphylococcal nuclease domain-containing protein 1
MVRETLYFGGCTDLVRYRAKVKRASGVKREALLYFIDYGNEETLPFSRIRPLDPKFKSLAGQAKEARLRWVPFLRLKSEEEWR